MARDEYIKAQYDARDKARNLKIYQQVILQKLQSIFQYDGIEDTGIEANHFNEYTYWDGFACIIEHNGKLYCVPAGLSGIPNQNFEQFHFIVANPYLNINREYEDGVDGVIIWNDSQHYGLRPIINKYSTLLVENELSLYNQIVNSRTDFLITAKDDATKKAAEEFLRQLEAGKPGIVLENEFKEGITVQPLHSGNNFTYGIELESYLLASLYNELGLNANKDQKREALASEEVSVNSQVLYPLIDDMLKCRVEGFKKVKDVFGVEITPKLASSWLINHDENDNNVNDEVETTTEEVKEEEGGGNSEED